MKLAVIFLFLISCTYDIAAQDVTLNWAKTIGGYADDYGNSIVADTAGNVYTLGSFASADDFGAGPIDNLALFITKHDKDGNLLWVKTINGTYTGGSGLSIALDRKGNICYGGTFSGTVDFDPGSGVFDLSTPLNSQSAFISKLDADGNFLWADKIDNAAVNSIAVDPSGNIYSTGAFYDVADFDPGPGTYNLSELGYNGLSSGITDIFVLKLDAAGKFVWAQRMGGVSSDEGEAIATDSYGNIVVTGYFEQSANLATGVGVFSNVTSNGGKDIFVLKLSGDGTFLWGGSMGGSSEDNGTSVCIDAADNVYVSGYFYGSADFDPGGSVSTLDGNPYKTSVFVVKIDSYFNFIWAKQIGGTGLDYGLGMCLDNFGSIYITGDYAGVTDFDPGEQVFNLSSNGYEDIFISKLDNNGNFIWAKSMGSVANEDVGRSIFVDPSANIYTTGWFWGTVDFDPEAGVSDYNSNGLADIFIQKLSQCHITFDTLNVSSCTSYTLNKQQFVKSGTYTQRLANSVGCDSIITIHLLLTGSRDTVNISTCESYWWQNHLYTSTGTYADTLKNSAGCDSILTLVLIVNKKIKNSVNTSICEGDNYNGYTLPGTYIDTLIASNGCDSIRTLFLTVKKKSVSNIAATICEGENYHGYTASGNYIDTLVAANGCDSIRFLQLLVNSKKHSVKDISICEGEFYFVSGTNRFTSGTYVDSMHTVFGCDSIITTNLTVNSKPMPQLGEDRNLCLGQPLTITPGVFKSYLWQDGSTASNLTMNNKGTYWVKVTDNNNCSANDSLRITGVLPSPSGFLIRADSICSYEKLNIGTEKIYADYLWSTGSNQSHITIDNAGIYNLTVTDNNGCKATESITIFPKNCYEGVYVPNAFTPNGDGKNDVFRPLVFGNVKAYSFTVYNRFGQKIFETNNVSMGWNGTLNGIAQPADVFVWTCTYQLQGSAVESKKGTVALIR
jgi:gliding motility-associated-like protein